MGPQGSESEDPPERDRGWDPMRYNTDEPWETQQSGRFFSGLAHRTRGSPARFVLRVVLAAGLLLWLALIVSQLSRIL